MAFNVNVPAPSLLYNGATGNLAITQGTSSSAVTIPLQVNPTIVGTGISTVTTSGTNYTVNTPPATLNYIPASGLLTHSQGTVNTSLNITPSVSFTSGTLTVGSNSAIIPGTGLWTTSGSNAIVPTTISNSVGIGIASPSAKLDILDNTAALTLNFFNSNTGSYTGSLFNSMSTLYTSRIANDGTGHALDVFKSGGASNGRAAQFTISNASNSSDVAAFSTNGGGNAIYAFTSGGGAAGYFSRNSSGNNFVSNHTGSSGYAGWFNINNASSTSQALAATTNGSGDAIGAYNTGSGRAIYASSGNAAQTILAANTGNGYALQASNTSATGRAGYFQGGLDINGKTTGTSSFALYVNNSASTNLFNVRDDGNVGIATTAPSAKLDVAGTGKFSYSGLSGPTLFSENTGAGAIDGSAAKFTNSGTRSIGHDGVLIENLTTKAGGSNSTKMGLRVESTGSWGPATANQPNIGLRVNVSGADNNYSGIFTGGAVGIGTLTPAATSSLHVAGKIAIVDGSQALGKVLTSDAAGVATWQAGQPKIAFNAGTNATTNQVIPASVTTVVQFGAGTNFFNDGGGYNTGTFQFTPPSAGIYFVSTFVSIQGTAGASLAVRISGPGPWVARSTETIPNTGNTIVHLSATINTAITPGPWRVEIFSTSSVTVLPYESAFSGFKIY
jgi:hypothetical protein